MCIYICISIPLESLSRGCFEYSIKSRSLNKFSIYFSIYVYMYEYTAGKSVKRILSIQYPCIESRSLNKVSMKVCTQNLMGPIF